MEAQVEIVAKKNGFASPAEYDVVLMNISTIMSCIDQQTKKPPSPPNKSGRRSLKADKSVPTWKRKRTRPSSRRREGRKARSVQGKHRVGAKVLDKLPLLKQEEGPVD